MSHSITPGASLVPPAPVTYVGNGRVVFDADSHIMELPGWLDRYASKSVRRLLRPLALGEASGLADRARLEFAERGDYPGSPDLDPTGILATKSWSALGAFDAVERSRALDLLGFDLQMVFPTMAYTQFRGGDPDLVFGGSEALNRAMCAFCDHDPRLLPVGTLPLGDPDRSLETARAAVRDGIAALTIDPDLGERDLAPSHPSYHPVWQLLEQENVPVVTHVADGTRSAVPPAFHRNGRKAKSFLGTETGLKSKDFMALHVRPETFWSCMVLDGVFRDFPGLRGASVEEGAMWIVTWVRQLDRAMQFALNEPTLRSLRKPPSDYVRDQFRATPFVGDDVAWIQREVGDEILMFSSDYPHPEGSVDPLGRFDTWLEGASEATRRSFFSGNLAHLFRGDLPAASAG